jgi:hypothetical protein
LRAWRAGLLAWILAVAAVFVVPGVAGAQGATLAASRAICDTAVNRRVSDLTALKADIATATHVSAADKATLDANITTAITGLQALKATFDADTTLAQLRVDCRKVVTGFYVYLFLVPQSHTVVAADRTMAAGAALTNLASLIQAQITADQAKGKSVSSAEGYETEIGVKASAAEQDATTAESAVLPLTAAGYPANRPTLVTALADMQSAKGAIAAALSDAQNALSALKGL